VKCEPFERLRERRVEENVPRLEKDDTIGELERALGALLRQHDPGARLRGGGEQSARSVGVELRGGLVEQEELRAEGESRG
jgi:hypothetical protein